MGLIVVVLQNVSRFFSLCPMQIDLGSICPQLTMNQITKCR